MERKPVDAMTGKKKPNFLVIGAAKCGTTSLYHYLAQHPQVYMSPRKHTRHFAFDEDRPPFRGPEPLGKAKPYALVDDEAYHALFKGMSGEKAAGEASHSYMYQPFSAERIKDYSPEMKLIAILRDPVERAFSHYKQMIGNGRERITDFVRAIEAEEARLARNWWPDFHYIQIGLYHRQLEKYFELFGREKVRVYLYEDFSSGPGDVMGDVFEFLGVDETFAPEAATRYNASGMPKNRAVHTLLKGMRKVRPVAENILPESIANFSLRIGSDMHNRNLSRAKLSPDVRHYLTDTYFREDIEKLQELLQKDLSAWLNRKVVAV